MMDPHLELLSRLAQPAPGKKMVLLVLDGVGDLRCAAQPESALDRAALPNLDALAARSSLGRIEPAGAGITPGSGPGHLSLFGYDPHSEAADIGRGVLEAMGAGMPVARGQVAARGNFATADADGNLTDRRAGRIPTAECRRLVGKLEQAVAAAPVDGLEVALLAGEGHRFVLRLAGPELSAEVADTDPQRTGVPPKPPTAQSPEAASTVERLRRLLPVLEAAVADEPQANRLLFRGFSGPPDLPQMDELYGIAAGAFAGYPLYRGVAAACGMKVVPCGKRIADILDTVEESWQRFDLFFLHVKQTDRAGEDGDLDAKVAVLEEVDREMPRLLALAPEVLAITGDHSTPAPMKAHSWHPVPLLLAAPLCFIDAGRAFTEEAATIGHLGTRPARELMALMLAHCGRLKKFGA